MEEPLQVITGIVRQVVARLADFSQNFIHGSRCQQIERGANRGTGPARPRTEAFNLPADGNVMDVRAVPSQQNIHPMHGGDRDVRGVHGGFGGNQARANNFSGEFADIFGRCQTRQTQQRRRAGRRHLRISASRLNVHKFGDKHLVITAPLLPPFSRRGLLAVQDCVPVRPRGSTTFPTPMLIVRPVRVQARSDEPTAAADKINPAAVAVLCGARSLSGEQQDQADEGRQEAEDERAVKDAKGRFPGPKGGRERDVVDAAFFTQDEFGVGHAPFLKH